MTPYWHKQFQSSVLILTTLCEKPLRFNEIKRHLDGIPQKALTHSLRRLERSGIVSRRVIPSSQIAVEYSITALGRTLEDPFRALFDWTINNSSKVLEAQSDFDRRIIESYEERVQRASCVINTQ